LFSVNKNKNRTALSSAMVPTFNVPIYPHILCHPSIHFVFFTVPVPLSRMVLVTAVVKRQIFNKPGGIHIILATNGTNTSKP
jgi:hypothetical protein